MCMCMCVFTSGYDDDDPILRVCVCVCDEHNNTTRYKRARVKRIEFLNSTCCGAWPARRE